jgi:hypothetical protein
MQSLTVALPQLSGGVLSEHVALGLAMPGAVVTWLVTGYRCPSSPLRLPLTGPLQLDQEVLTPPYVMQDSDSVMVKVCAVRPEQRDSHRVGFGFYLRLMLEIDSMT